MSDETTSGSPAGGQLDRRELLKKAGQVGAGAVAASALGGTGGRGDEAAPRRPDQAGRQADLGARVGSGACGAVRRDPDREPLGEGVRLRLAGRVGPEPERQARPRREVRDHQQDGDPLDAEAGRQVPQRQGSHGRRRQVLGRADAQPAAAGEHLHRRAGAGDRQGPGRLEVRLHPAPEAGRRPHHRLLRLAALRTDRPGGSLRPDQRLPERDRHRPVPDARLRAERPRRVRQVREALEEGLPVHGLDAAEDPRRRAGPRCGAACRGDRRRDALGRGRPVAGEQQRPDRPEGAERRLPRAADDDQARRGQAVAQEGACAWRSTTRSTARTSSGGSTAARPSTRGMFRPATAPGR